MDILNVGLAELLFIFVIALMVFGPRRLPEIAAKAGKFVADLRRMSNSLLVEWQREINVSNQLEEFKKVRDEFQGAKQDLSRARRDVGTIGRSLVNEAKKVTASSDPVNQQQPSPQPPVETAAATSPETQETAGVQEAKNEDRPPSPISKNGAAGPASVPRAGLASPPASDPVAETTIARVAPSTPAESEVLADSSTGPNGSPPPSAQATTEVADG
jgi:sec-independent protein translocase protein TatB